MAPPNRERLRRIIRKRIADARRVKGWDEKQLAKAVGVVEVSIKRWEGTAKDPSVPSLEDAKRLAAALDVTLDWLVGYELTPEQTVATVIARVEEDMKGMHSMLDQLLADIFAAKAALKPIDEPQIDVAAGATVIRRRKKRGE